MIGNLGAKIAGPLARLRAVAGIVFTWNGLTIHATEKFLDVNAAAELVEGNNGINAANPDIRLWRATPIDFSGGVYVPETVQVTKLEGGIPVSFTVARRDVQAVNGVDIAVEIVVYRTPETTTQLDTPPGGSGPTGPQRFSPPNSSS